MPGVFGLKFWKSAVLFYLGGGVYMTLEFMWRGYSHWSMFLLGGLCFLLLGQLGKWELPLWSKVILGAGMITALELGMGLLVNRDFTVWDYRTMPYNYRGQICLNFSLLWIPASLAAMRLYDKAEQRIQIWYPM